MVYVIEAEVNGKIQYRTTHGWTPHLERAKFMSLEGARRCRTWMENSMREQYSMNALQAVETLGAMVIRQLQLEFTEAKL